MTSNVSDTVAIEVQRAYELIRRGDLQNATNIGNGLIRQYRSDPRGWYLLSDVNFRRGLYMPAVECAERAVALRPRDVNYNIQLGRCLAMAGRKVESIAAVNEGAKQDPTDASLCDAIGSIYSLCDEQELALPFLEKAVNANPDNISFRYNLAAVQRMLGQLTEAEANCNIVIEQDPHAYRAYYTRADLRRWQQDDHHIREMESVLLAGIKNWRDEMAVRFALAKECEDVKDYRSCFRYLKSACDLQRGHMRYDVREDIAVIDQIVQTHTAEALAGKGAGFDNEEPIFIVGLPRTGTTLVDRILGSHTQVYSAGELNNLGAQLTKAVQGQFDRQVVPKMEMVEQALSLDFEALGRSYLESTRPRTGYTRMFIDKLPQNYLYCGLIHAALPRARIILMNRNPMDTCYAVYKALFTGIYPFSYDLNDLGNYFLAYWRLTGHWRELLGGAMLDVHYEDLVTDQESQTRRLLEFCGLEWEDACLEFHRSPSASSTASAVQVRQRMYTSSIGRWRAYEEELQQLTTLFQEHGLAIE